MRRALFATFLGTATFSTVMGTATFSAKTWLSPIQPGTPVPWPGTQGQQGVLITGGLVVDGMGTPGRRAAVRIKGDTIVEIGPNLTPQGEQILDATGLVVAPGFIDSHSHADRGLSQNPDATSQVMQGITTAIVGQDGSSALPISDFFDAIADARPSINFATLVGHGSVRRVVMGGDFKRAAAKQEIETMKALVKRGMEDGAHGLSSGLEYDPGHYAEPAELIELAGVLNPSGRAVAPGFYSSHVRDEENKVFDAWREAIDVGRRAKVPVLISHMKLASKPVWGKAEEGLKILDSAQREGLTVMADWYPYTYWQSAMYVLIPDRDFDNRDKWTVGLEEIGGAQNVLITNYRPDPSWNGRTVTDIATSTGKDPVTLIIEMIRTAGPNIGIIGTSMIEPDLDRIFAHPQVVICSDGGLSGRHPRGYGAFPRVLGRYVRERKLVSLEEAVAKMTLRIARLLGWSSIRGAVREGWKADITIFDADRIVDNGTPDDPSKAPIGVRHVIVNGQIVLRDGVMTGARPGLGLANPIGVTRVADGGKKGTATFLAKR